MAKYKRRNKKKASDDAILFDQDDQKHIVRGTKSYQEGRLAFMNDDHNCPYFAGDDRMFWWTGYYDERIVQRLGPNFENWDGIERLNTNKEVIND